MAKRRLILELNMIHLWLGDTEVESFALSDPSREYVAAYTDSQQWANDYCHSVELWRYQGHEMIDEGELLDTVWPQPVQLALMPGAEVVITEEEAYIGPEGSEIEILPTVLGVTLDDGQWVTFMNTVTEDWVREYIAKAYPGRAIVEIRWDDQP